MSITDDVVARGGDGDVEELSHAAIEEIRGLVPSPRDAVVRRQAYVYDTFFAEDLRRDADQARLGCDVRRAE